LRRDSEGLNYLEFGAFASFVNFYVKEATGEVMMGEVGRMVFVNDSLSKFSESVREMISRFPYIDQDGEYEEWETAALELEGVLRSIDPRAVTEGAFWEEFVADVSIGDYY
jgi:hypothetical protein